MKKNMLFFILLGTMPLIAEEPLNFLKNANFAKFTKNKTPESWKVYGEADFELENRMLKITIKDAVKNVSITQKISGLPANTKLLLSGKLKSSKENLAYLQVKCKIDKKEIKRLNSKFSSLEEKEFNIELSTLESNNVTIIVRFSKERQQRGDIVWVKDLKLTQGSF